MVIKNLFKTGLFVVELGDGFKGIVNEKRNIALGLNEYINLNNYNDDLTYKTNNEKLNKRATVNKIWSFSKLTSLEDIIYNIEKNGCLVFSRY